MQLLLFERATTTLSPHEFAATYTELLYSSLRQFQLFPKNCHQNAAVNSLSLDKLEYKYLLSGCADSLIKLWGVDEEVDIAAEGAYETKTKERTEERTGESQELPAKSSGNSSESLRAASYVGFRLQTANPTPKLLATIPKRSEHQFGVSAVHWWPHDTGLFVSASFDHTVKVWDTNELSVAHTFDMGSRVYSVSISSSSSNQFLAQALVAVGSDQPFIRLLDLRTASSAHTLQGHKGKTLAVTWHPHFPNILALGGYDGEAKIWDIRRSKLCVARLDMTKTNVREAKIDALNLGANSVKAHSGPVNALKWDETGRTLYTLGNDDRIRVWDLTASVAPPINKLINFGPLTRNKYLQNLPILLSPQAETETQHLLFPLDNGDILVFRAIDGKLVTRLGRSGSEMARTALLVCGGPWSATYHCGTMDGEILTWRGQKYEEESESERETEDVEKIEEKISREMLYNDPYFRRRGEEEES